MNRRVRKGMLTHEKNPEKKLAEDLRGYLMESAFTNPENGRSYTKIEFIFDTKGPIEDFNNISNHPRRVFVQGEEPYPGVTFIRSSTSYNPGLDERTCRLIDKYGTFDHRVKKMLDRHNFVYVFVGFQPTKIHGLPE